MGLLNVTSCPDMVLYIALYICCYAGLYIARDICRDAGLYIVRDICHDVGLYIPQDIRGDAVSTSHRISVGMRVSILRWYMSCCGSLHCAG